MHESAIHVCFCHEEKNAKCMHNMCENDLARFRQLPQWFEWIPFNSNIIMVIWDIVSCRWFDMIWIYFCCPLICSNHLLCDIVEHSSSAFRWDARVHSCLFWKWILAVYLRLWPFSLILCSDFLHASSLYLGPMSTKGLWRPTSNTVEKYLFSAV